MNINDILKKTLELIEDNLDNQDLNICFLATQLFVRHY